MAHAMRGRTLVATAYATRRSSSAAALGMGPVFFEQRPSDTVRALSLAIPGMKSIRKCLDSG